MITGLVISDLSAKVNSDISELTLKLESSWSMDGASQIRFTVQDQKLQMLANRYFQVRRTVKYGNSTFEIASIEVQQGEGEAPNLVIEARNAAIQKMKRDKQPGAYQGVSGTDYARIVANKFGLKFVGEPTSKKKAVIQTSTGTKQDSVWDVLTRSASEAEFVTFESDGTLYFASQEWLLGKWANLALRYPSSDKDTLMLLEVPQCRRSEDDPLEADFRAVLARPNAKNLRPGMTVVLSGLYEFDGKYLISEVAYDEGIEEPVGIACRTAEKKK